MVSKLSDLPSPCYVFQESLLRENLKLLQQIQQEAEIKILLALKGFAFWPLFPLLKKYLPGASASSLNEARLCSEEMGVPAHCYCVAYHPEEVEELFSLSSHLSFNSLTEFSRYKSFAKEGGASLGLRVNPLFSNLPDTFANPARSDSRLGILPEELRSSFPEEIEGLHVHSLNESSAKAMASLLKALEAHFSEALHQVKWVNLGGGHLLTDPSYGVPEMVQLLREFRSRYQVEIFLELGTAISWKAGFLQCTVLDILPREPYPIALLDISFPIHLADKWIYSAPPIVRGASEGQIGKATYILGGSSCMADDIGGVYSFDTPLSSGDTLILENSLHYSLEKSSHFNGIRHPAIAICKENGEVSLIRTYGYTDYKRHFS